MHRYPNAREHYKDWRTTYKNKWHEMLEYLHIGELLEVTTENEIKYLRNAISSQNLAYSRGMTPKTYKTAKVGTNIWRVTRIK